MATEPRTIEDVLRRCAAMLTATQVRAFFMGALTSARLGLGPHHLLGTIFGPEPVLGDDLDDANANFQALGMAWNDLVTEREEGIIRLSTVPIAEPLDTRQVAELAGRRADEILWFIRGIDAGGDDPESFGPAGRQLFQKLAEASAFFERYLELLKRQKAHKAGELAVAWNALGQLTDTVEHIMADLMTVGDEMRSRAIEATAGGASRARRGRAKGPKRRGRKVH